MDRMDAAWYDDLSPQPISTTSDNATQIANNPNSEAGPNPTVELTLNAVQTRTLARYNSEQAVNQYLQSNNSASNHPNPNRTGDATNRPTAGGNSQIG